MIPLSCSPHLNHCVELQNTMKKLLNPTLYEKHLSVCLTDFTNQFTELIIELEPMIEEQPELCLWQSLSKNPNLGEVLLTRYKDRLCWYSVSMSVSLSIRLLEKTQHLPWDWHGISFNNSLTMEIINKYKDVEWDWESISRNSAMTTEIIEKYLDKPWNWYSFNFNPNITREFVLKYINKFVWDVYYLPKHKIPIELAELPHIGNRDPYYNTFSQLPYLTIDILKRTITKPYNWNYVSSREDITVDEMFENMDIPWCFKGISRNISLRLDHVISKIDANWDWTELSKHPCITMEFIESNLTKPWSIVGIMSNPNLTISVIRKLVNEVDMRPKAWEILSSRNDIITIELVRELDTTKLFWNKLSKNSGITMDDIRDNPHFQWSFQEVSKNTNLNFKFLQEMTEKDWDWGYIYTNAEQIRKNVDMDIFINFIKQFYDIPRKTITLGALSVAKYLTFKDVRKYRTHPLKWSCVLSNPFIDSKTEAINIVMRNIYRTYLIDEELMQTAWAPSRHKRYLIEYNYNICEDCYMYDDKDV